MAAKRNYHKEGQMRKLLFAAAGLVAMFVAVPVSAADISLSGEVRVRGFWSDNLTDGDSSFETSPITGVNDESRFNDGRFRLKTAIKAGVTTAVAVLDIGNCYFGSVLQPVTPSTINGGAAGAGATGDCRFGTAGLGGSFVTVGVREAYMHIDLNAVGLILGRQTIKLGHGIVFDDTSDAITVVVPMNGTTITGSMLQVADNADALAVPGLDKNNDTTIWVLNLGMDHGNHTLNVYDALVWDDGFGSTDFANTVMPVGGLGFPVGLGGIDHVWWNTIGVSIDAMNGPLALMLEGSYTHGGISLAVPGSTIRLTGYNVMGDATFDAGGAKVGATVVYASGQEGQGAAVNHLNVGDISGNFQLGNILLNNEQFADRDGSSVNGGFAGQGLFAVKLHGGTMPSDKVKVDGAVIYAQTTELCNPFTCVVPSTSRVLGFEFDANAAYMVDDNLTFSAGAGYLVSGDGLSDFYTGFSGAPGDGSDSNLWKLVGRATYTF